MSVNIKATAAVSSAGPRAAVSGELVAHAMAYSPLKRARSAGGAEGGGRAVVKWPSDSEQGFV